ncbi:hypothetical protein EV193_104331 [Herbihabitans rhizosphaerae]|uniref:TRAP transporter TAXI family solute receptor n=1 Tax=Herbihabitans rhizosphaerae TaxID=1872711 RepID=A0A4Q7KQK6_9PSEU|nr:TAXI family TRAP transporter solute-binding subunit [Herbihabitans rhizosphaerae]RZS39118.1 hypothetical protein EV193_104331 [Herbihabitans rhizosphaerae]
MSVSRRAILRAGAGLAAGFAGGCAAGGYDGPERTVRIAAGEPGGFYVEFARVLAAEIHDAEPALNCVVTETGGSVANLQQAADGRADLALSLADVASAALHGRTPFTGEIPLRALGRVYENYTQLVVLADSPLRTAGSLAGRRVSLGAPGSGAAVVGERLLAAARLNVRVDHQPLADAVAALERRAIDALLWSGGVPTPALAELDRRTGIRLLDPTEYLPALRAEFGRFYQRVSVPAGSYRTPADVPTVGVANLLVCAPNLPDTLASTVVRVLVQRADRLVPQQALGTQYLDVRSLIGTTDVPLHPGAVAAYRTLHG